MTMVSLDVDLASGGRNRATVGAAIVALSLLAVPLGLLAATPSARLADTQPTGLFVAGDAGRDEGDCREPDAPCATIAYALAMAQAGDTVNVAAGTYTQPLTITQQVWLRGGLDPQNGWNSCSDPCRGTCMTTIDGSTAPTGPPNGAIPLVLVSRVGPSTPVTITGFTITGAKQGALKVHSSAVEIRHSAIVSNTHFWVAGIELVGSVARVEDSIIACNRAEADTGIGTAALTYASQLHLDRVTLAHNGCVSREGGCRPGILAPPNATLRLQSTIMWGHDSRDIEFHPGLGSCTIDYSDVEMLGTDGVCPEHCACNHSFSEDPQFVGPQGCVDLGLRPESPCIGAGYPGAAEPGSGAANVGACPADQTLATASPVATEAATPSPTAAPTRTPADGYLPYASRRHVIYTPTPTPTPTNTPVPTDTPVPTNTPRPTLCELHVVNATGGELCYEVHGTRIGRKCYGGGSRLYGTIPAGVHRFTARARCGSMDTQKHFPAGVFEHRFDCR